MDKIREAIQQYLDSEGDGWTVTQYVVAMGLQRITSNGELESIGWYYTPDGQADWQTTGLLEEATSLHQSSEEEDD